MAKWIEFKFSHNSESGKTKVWQVIAEDGYVVLGGISWFARWRKYTFMPYAGTVFEQDCLRDIAAFCEAETKKHKEPTSACAVIP